MRAKRRDGIKRKIRDAPIDQDDPNDVKAIVDLETNLGDWELKSSPSYKVSVEKQVDTRGKLMEMIICEDSMHNIKTAFNKEFLELQSERKRLLKLIKRKNRRIVEVCDMLGEPTSIDLLWAPSSPEETSIDTNDSTILAENKESRSAKEQCEGKETYDLYKILPQLMPTMGSDGSSPRSSTELSSIEQDEKVEQEALLKHEKSELLKEIDTQVNSFDESLYSLCKKRFQLAIELKGGELRLVTMLEELKLLSPMEKEGKNLVSKRRLCQMKKKQVRE